MLVNVDLKILLLQMIASEHKISSLLTIDCTGTSKRFTSSQDLSLVASIDLSFTLIRPINLGTKSFAITRSTGDIRVVEDLITGFNDGYGDSWVFAQSVGNDETTAATTHNDEVITRCRFGKSVGGSKCGGRKGQDCQIGPSPGSCQGHNKTSRNFSSVEQPFDIHLRHTLSYYLIDYLPAIATRAETISLSLMTGSMTDTPISLATLCMIVMSPLCMVCRGHYPKESTEVSVSLIHRKPQSSHRRKLRRPLERIEEMAIARDTMLGGGLLITSPRDSDLLRVDRPVLLSFRWTLLVLVCETFWEDQDVGEILALIALFTVILIGNVHVSMLEAHEEAVLFILNARPELNVESNAIDGGFRHADFFSERGIS
ncbi:hypothetical protein KCU61_g34, partial [Aureobasidium melanogenum]